MTFVHIPEDHGTCERWVNLDLIVEVTDSCEIDPDTGEEIIAYTLHPLSGERITLHGFQATYLKNVLAELSELEVVIA